MRCKIEAFDLEVDHINKFDRIEFPGKFIAHLCDHEYVLEIEIVCVRVWY